MGFYGNSYHYTTESFAKVVLTNLGFGKQVTSPEAESSYTLVPSGEQYSLNAKQRETGLGIQSGNHWIQLAKPKDDTNNTFQIFHGPPATRSNPEDRTYFTPCLVLPQAEASLIEDVASTQIEFGDYLIVPDIEFDEAGHLTVSALGSNYYRLPLDPNLDLNTRMDSLENRMSAIDGKDSAGAQVGNSLLDQVNQTLENNLEDINKIKEDTVVIKTETEEIQQAVMDELSKVGDFNAAMDTLSLFKSATEGNSNRIEALESELEAIKQLLDKAGIK